MAFDANLFGGGLGSLLGGLFGNSGAPFEDFMKQYQQYANKGAEAQQPWWEAGKNAIPDFQNWLKNMQNPSDFLNKMMGNYQQSDYAKNLTNQSMRAAQNAGSAQGLNGSTAMNKFMEQQAGNIASGDMQNWLKNALGINDTYGGGLEKLMSGGQHSADQLSQLYQKMAEQMGGASAYENKGKSNDWWNTIGGGLGMFGSFFGL